MATLDRELEVSSSQYYSSLCEVVEVDHVYSRFSTVQLKKNSKFDSSIPLGPMPVTSSGELLRLPL